MLREVYFEEKLGRCPRAFDLAMSVGTVFLHPLEIRKSKARVQGHRCAIHSAAVGEIVVFANGSHEVYRTIWCPKCRVARCDAGLYTVSEKRKRRKYDKRLPCTSCKQGGVTCTYTTMPGPLAMECRSIRLRYEKDLGELRARTERLGELEQLERSGNRTAKESRRDPEYHLSTPPASVRARPCISALPTEAGADDRAHYAERQEDGLGQLLRDLTMVEGGFDCLSCPDTGFAAGRPRTLATDIPSLLQGQIGQC